MTKNFKKILPFQKMDKEVKKEIDEAVQQARADAELPLSELYTNIYSQPPADYQIRTCDPFHFVTP